jgi:hypothetical protein
VRIYNLVENQWNGRNKKFKHITLHFWFKRPRILHSKKDTCRKKFRLANNIANQYDAVVVITGQGNQVNLEG